MYKRQSISNAAEFKPYQEAKISLNEFQEYRAIIVEEFGETAKLFPEQNLVIYFDNSMGNYAFTVEGHAAHPSWIARRVVQDDGSFSIEQIGYFAGEEKHFAYLYQQYLDLNEQIKKNIGK